VVVDWRSRVDGWWRRLRLRLMGPGGGMEAGSAWVQGFFGLNFLFFWFKCGRGTK